ncbi:hypothetical protein ACEQPO_13065 [Bacillus sp. SL00103]
MDDAMQAYPHLISFLKQDVEEVYLLKTV